MMHNNLSDYSIKISVIVPVYNAEPYLRKCLDCLVSQTLKDIEIICVDDGSTDSSLNILKTFAEQENRIKIIEQEHKNAGAARNAGLDVARGKYLSFLDADDLFELDMLERAYKEAETHSTEVLIFDADIFDDNSGKPLPAYWIIDKTYIPNKDVFSADDIRDKIFTAFFMVAWNRLYNARYILDRNLRFQEIEKQNDSYFSVMSLIYANRIRCIDSVFVHYRKGVSTQISSAFLGKKDFYPPLLAMKAIRNEIQSMNSYNAMLGDFLKYSSPLLLNAFNDIVQEDYFRVFSLLKETWLPGFPGEVFTKDNFNAYDEYRQMQSIRENDAIGHLFTLLKMKNEAIEIIDFLNANKRRYFFDEEIEHGCDIVLYGAGNIGKDYYRQFSESKQFNLVAWIDQNYMRYQKQGFSVNAPEIISKLSFDYVIIAVIYKHFADDIKEALRVYGIPESKMIWPFKSLKEDKA